MFEKIISIGLIEAVTSCIHEYAQAVTLAKASQEAEGDEDHPMDGGLISTGGPLTLESTYSETTISLLVGVLHLGSRFSHPMIATILTSGTVQVLSTLLPTDEGQDQPTFTADLVSLFNVMLP